MGDMSLPLAFGLATIGLVLFIARFGQMLLQRVEQRLERVEQKQQEILSTLPLEYQRREDAIRFETVLTAKLDAIGVQLGCALERRQT